MRPASPPLVPVFRSRLQGDLLALLLGGARREWTIDELARQLDTPYPTLAAEIRRLEAAELVVARHVGRSKLLGVNERHPLLGPLRELAVKAFGPPTVIAEELRGVEGCESALLYGSWASRYHGSSGAFPNDIDLLVVGDVDRDAVYAAAERAERRLGQEVNVTIRTAAAWEGATDGFTQQVKGSPWVEVDLA